MNVVRPPRRSRWLPLLILLPALDSCDARDPEPQPESSVQSTQALVGNTPCATAMPTAAELQAIRQAVAARPDRKTALGGKALLSPTGSIVVPVYFHNIKRSSGNDRITDGHLGDDVFDATLAKLNADFAGTPFRFVKRAISRHVNAAWSDVGAIAEDPSQAEGEMKSQLRVGGAQALNIYSQMGSLVASKAEFPHKYEGQPWRDGVVLHIEHAPRAGVDGDPISHEVGHWLGLLHTFHPNGPFSSPGSGTCDAVGDDVSDTPTENSPNRTDCTPGVRDTCPNPPGQPDPITNMMAYTPEACPNIRQVFTPNQIARMDEQWATYRQRSFLHLVGVTTDNRLQHAVRRAEGWARFNNVLVQTGNPGTITGIDARALDGELHVAAVVNGSIHHSIRKDWKWTRFANLGAVGALSASMGRTPEGLHFCVATHGGIKHALRRPSGTVSAFGDVKPEAGDPGFAKAVDCAGVGNDLHYVVATSTNQIKLTTRRSNGTWAAFQTLFTLTEAVTDVDLDTTGTDLHLIVTTPDRQFHALRTGATFTALGNVESEAENPGGRLSGGAAAGERSDLHTIETDSNGQLYHTIRFPSGNWEAFENVKSFVPNGSGAGDFSFAALSDAMGGP
jgi:hypothetical protein